MISPGIFWCPISVFKLSVPNSRQLSELFSDRILVENDIGARLSDDAGDVRCVRRVWRSCCCMTHLVGKDSFETLRSRTACCLDRPIVVQVGINNDFARMDSKEPRVPISEKPRSPRPKRIGVR